MALRILQFSTLFTIVCCSIGSRPTRNLPSPSHFPKIRLTLNLTDPKDVVVQRGQSAALTCEAVSSNGDIKYQWLHNGKRLQENDNRWIVQSDGTLYIPKVLVGKKSNGVIGEYQCLVSNKDGTILSNPARLKVASIDSEFSTHPISKDVPKGETFILKCSISSTPPVIIQWELNNSTLPQNNRYVPLPNGALIIHDSRISDSGSYRCKAINDLLKKTRYSKVAVVSVTAAVTRVKAPYILPLDISVNKTIFYGENLTLYCPVIGWPKATVQWFSDRKIVISNGTSLDIINASKDDIGNYTCTTRNSEGSTQRQFRVDVLQKPRIILIPVSKFSPPSSTVRLNCTAEGIPEPKIIWLKDGVILNYTARIKKQFGELVFSHTFANDSGFYQCVAFNSVGRVWKAARIVIAHHLQPSPPQNLQCRSYDSTSICLHWTAPEKVKAYSIYSFFKDKDGFEQQGPDAVSNMTFHLLEGLNYNVNYTFYVLSFSDAASDPSEIVTCTTDTEPRKLDISLVKPGATLVKWNELGKDKECDGKKHVYRVQWREEGQESAYVETTEQRSLVVEGLLPKRYEFRVTTVTDPDPLWYNYIVPLSNNHSGASITSEFNQTNVPPMAPNNFEGKVKSSSSVSLTWSDPDNLAKYFTVCYFPVSETKKECDNETQLTSQTTELQISNLKPNTTYEFKVRAYNFFGLSSPYSQSIEIHTPEEVPSSVSDLNYTLINESTVCLHWEEPQRKNGILKSYIISYTPDKNWPLENWLNVSVPPYQQKSMKCWTDGLEWLGTGPNTISVVLSNLTSETQYMVLVRAVSQGGIGDPTYPVIVNTKVSNSSEDSMYKQKLAIVLGTITALLCILGCIICLLLRRRCLKRRALTRPRLPTSNNLYPAVAHYATHADSVQVRLEDSCAQESQHLVEETITASVPPITSNFIDAKGGEECPNGHLNGSAKPYMNGGLSKKPMHIRENPQYYAHQCNGHAGHRKPFRYEEDSNSNVKHSKFYNLQKLFENSKKDGISRYNHCSPLESNDKTVQSSDDEGSNEYDSLNVTRLTCLDDSFGLNVNNNKRTPSVSDPKG